MKTILTLFLAVLVFLALSFPALAENSTRIPGYVIHHNALTTDFLQAEVAKTYGIRRSKNRGMLNVSVIKEVPDTTGEAVTAKVNAKASNLMGQSQNIELKRENEIMLKKKRKGELEAFKAFGLPLTELRKKYISYIKTKSKAKDVKLI